ncbi:hypothetical protein F5B21DRAFT_254741 [Xylaria acuta]|nr:hypothetical protein F5B21DRAFT_254741 [Xylaria acuta]
MLDSNGDDIPKPISIPEQKSQDDIPDALALYMPYFTFSTLTEEEFNPGLTQQAEEDADRVGETPPPSYRQADSHESRIIRIIRAFRHMIRAAQPRTEDSHTGGPPLPEAKPRLSLIPQVETYQKLIKAYKEGGGILHCSQTLDEYFYHSLSDKAAQTDLELRNQTQVTSKRILEVGPHGGCQGDWTIIRVDHLWLWIIDDKNIISSSTHRMDKIHDPILEGIWKYMNSEEVQSGRASLPSSSYKMAQFITEFCINFFHHATCKVGQVEESIPEIYKNAINKTSRDEALLLDKFTRKVDSVMSSLKAAGSQSAADLEAQARQQVKSNFVSIRRASELLKQIKDIRDEINMLKSVLTQQKSVWNELHDRQAGEHNLRGPAYAINNIDEMDAQAARVQDAVLSVLGLEQNEASIQEAMTSREQAQESIRQGRTLMAFTVVTIFFLPGSFLVALFALNIAVFPRSGSGEDVYWPNWVFAIIFGLTIALLAIIMTIAFYLDNVKRFVKKLNDKTKPRVASTGASTV